MMSRCQSRLRSQQWGSPLPSSRWALNRTHRSLLAWYKAGQSISLLAWHTAGQSISNSSQTSPWKPESDPLYCP